MIEFVLVDKNIYIHFSINLSILIMQIEKFWVTIKCYESNELLIKKIDLKKALLLYT